LICTESEQSIHNTKDVISRYWFYSKEHGLSHGITTTEDNDNKSSNEKATQAYKLFSVGKRSLKVAIEINLGIRILSFAKPKMQPTPSHSSH